MREETHRPGFSTTFSTTSQLKKRTGVMGIMAFGVGANTHHLAPAAVTREEP
jgi:hypothetical protein